MAGFTNLRGGSRNPATSEMELFTTIVKFPRPLTNVENIFSIDVMYNKFFIISYGKQELVPLIKIKYGFLPVSLCSKKSVKTFSSLGCDNCI